MNFMPSSIIVPVSFDVFFLFLFWTILSDIQIIALNYIQFFIRTFGT